MKIEINITELEIAKVRAALNKLYDGEADSCFDWADPADLAQAVKDTITEVLE